MASYIAIWAVEARKYIKSLPRDERRAIGYAVHRLQQDPTDGDTKKLGGTKGLWRLRVGDHRILYTIDHGKLVIEVVRAANRREVYK